MREVCYFMVLAMSRDKISTLRELFSFVLLKMYKNGRLNIHTLYLYIDNERSLILLSTRDIQEYVNGILNIYTC